MPYKIVPLTPNANQSFTCTLPVDGKNITLGFTVRYNTVGEYWFMSVSDMKTNAVLLDAVPLVTGEYPAADILGQYEYLGIGSAAIVPTSSLATEIPDDTNLGTEYVLIWSDTVR
ncbi:phage baseplate plug protein [Paenibacillus sp. GCM10012303]|uniref:phage baseplate plug family protein n=1 Tax=Paenibacillus sp. GCM10012303 TaxID=3317340 RepID=UPI00361137D2